MPNELLSKRFICISTKKTCWWHRIPIEWAAQNSDSRSSIHVIAFHLALLFLFVAHFYERSGKMPELVLTFTSFFFLHSTLVCSASSSAYFFLLFLDITKSFYDLKPHSSLHNNISTIISRRELVRSVFNGTCVSGHSVNYWLPFFMGKHLWTSTKIELDLYVYLSESALNCLEGKASERRKHRSWWEAKH